MNPLLYVDSYKIHHTKMYPEGMTKLYSNFTPRKSRIPGIESVVTFGLQHFIKEYLIDKFNKEFFGMNEKSKIYLIVTHGIFSKGFKELNRYFDNIYCTNSYKDIANDEYGEITNVKQSNIF